MLRFIARRLALMVPLLLGVSFLTFAIINLIPGSPVTLLRENPRIRPEAREVLIKQLGLDQPWPVRYVQWLGNAARGDFGYSLYNRAPVTDRILNVLPNTLLLTGIALGFAILAALPLGIIAAVRHNTIFDRLANFFAVAFYAMPDFLMALLLVIVLALKFNEWGLPSLPVGGMSDPRGSGDLAERARYLVLPVMALSLVQIGSWSAFIRSKMLDTLSQEYVRTARAKGVMEYFVIMRHTLRNALMPLITLIALSIPGLFGGAVIVESIFAWNGIGRLTIEAVNRRDYTMIMGTTLMFAALTMLANLMSDVIYTIIDPRVRVS